ncbi:MAG: TraR/DksA family transcriptional regulator [Planctomycetaceae bacterium]|nr:TraR/DksA family transcriptional regulator [Planctomycetaceae bacterium]
MSKTADFDEFRQSLLQLRARIRGDVRQLTDEALEPGESGGDSRSPTHLAELGSQAWEQDFCLRFVESDQEVLEEIEAALSRIAEGTYGQCEGCVETGKSVSRSRIPKPRLRARPFARNCVECERKREELSL